MAVIDETNNKYGKLTVLKRDYSKKNSQKHAYWLCQCECGNQTIVLGTKLRNGETKSCGCLRAEKAKNNTINLIGQKFGRLTVIERAGSSDTGLALWKCQCDCGNIVTVFGSNLRSGHTTSCGCYFSEQTKERIENENNITGQRFGKLIAISRLESKKGTNHLWKCKCDCGNECEVDINSLTQGKKSSCGCLGKSKGEYIIEEILKENNIIYIKEKTFNTCRSPKTNWLYRFDFYVNNKYIIEYDGKQHFNYVENTNSWNNKDNYEETIFNDKIKNKWCIENKIPLIRIPYTNINNIKLEDLLLETSNFIYKGDNNGEGQ